MNQLLLQGYAKDSLRLEKNEAWAWITVQLRNNAVPAAEISQVRQQLWTSLAIDGLGVQPLAVRYYNLPGHGGATFTTA
jgi:hypothetical protein